METARLTRSDIVEREIQIAARPETIFAFFIDPAKMMRWKGIDVALNARPGGLFRAQISSRNTVRGHYLEVVPYSRIVFSWGWENDNQLPPGVSIVEISLVPQGATTLVRLRHSGLASVELRQSHGEGWDHYLPRLATAASGGDAGPDPWAQ